MFAKDTLHFHQKDLKVVPHKDLALSKHKSARKSVKTAAALLEKLSSHSYAHLVAAVDEYAVYATTTSTLLAPVKFHDEIYVPWCFMQNNQVVGGAYLHTWVCGESSQKAKPMPPLNKEPKKAFVTGTCLFGDGLLGEDELKQTHSLTHPDIYTQLKGKKIQAIHEAKSSHPYETMMQAMLNNLTPLIHSFTDSKSAVVALHLPVPEYLVHGIKMMVQGQISKQAFQSYMKCVIGEGARLKENFNNLAAAHHLTIQMSSPLDVLQLEHVAVTDLLVASVASTSPTLAEKQLAKMLLNKLVSLNDSPKNPWKLYQSQTNEDDLSLLALTQASYVVHVAMASATYGSKNICLLDMASEILIGKKYAKMFSTAFDPILCMHWLPPFYLHDKKFNEIYLCGDGEKAVTALLPQSLAEGPLQTGQYVYQTLKWHSLFTTSKLDSLPSPVQKIISEYDGFASESPAETSDALETCSIPAPVISV